MRAHRVLAVFAALTLLAAPATALARAFDVRVVWIAGMHDGSAPEYDRFMHCLIERSNFADYFDGMASVSYSGLTVAPGPSAGMDITDGATQAAWLSGLVSSGAVPAPRASVTTVYLVIGDDPTAGICAHFRNAYSVAGVNVGMGLVSTHCWGTDPIRNATQLGQHEIAESIEAFLGFNGCGGDGSCEASSGCAGSCSNFVGLSCDGSGAPATTDTHCGGLTVSGWLVQRLGREHRVGPCNPDSCAACDFTPVTIAGDICSDHGDCNGCAASYDCGWCGATAGCMIGLSASPACGGAWVEEARDCPVCGDHTCAAAETCTSCATDCGACPPPDAGAPDLGVPDLGAPDGGATPMDAAADAFRPPTPLHGGCCSAAGTPTASAGALLAAVFLFGVGARRRRR